MNESISINGVDFGDINDAIAHLVALKSQQKLPSKVGKSVSIIGTIVEQDTSEAPYLVEFMAYEERNELWFRANEIEIIDN